MSLTLYEDHDSGQISTGENGQTLLKFTLDGTQDRNTALALALSSPMLPSYLDGKTRQGVEVDPIPGTVDTLGGSGKWKVQARYGYKPSPAETGEQMFQFETGGGSQHITQALAHISHTPCHGITEAQDFGGAIGVTGSAGSRSAEGVDITVPVYSWSETWYLTDTFVQANRNLWYALTGRTNAAVWRGYAIGEVLFVGCSGQKKGDSNWEITFKFDASPNVADFCASWPASSKPASAVPKKGWEVASVYYREAAGTNDLLPKPVQIDINKVYPEGNFGGLPA